ncbi:MAG: bifunctional 5,10-methylene-tetrahydrofolate dehydrogenase/5,10-methylene-tetrahydrofolate cyclohydrolase [Lentisphaerae bacterium RIFOXYA12_FULL_48_11]|nr:MAG: bifunctional 5,10-methylene-tetrahydrofolate dehydrogenase/5,10-methylene-tetrahydrofolate cyclohydrolase [Lentisphaerae bacterium RIFOXYA12_FULL_48_11]
MTANIIDGKQIAADIRNELKHEVSALKQKGITPGLGVILVGEDPASKSYVTAKERACEEIGLYSDDYRLPRETTQADLITLVKKMNADPKINGILVQLPLPKHINESDVLMAIDPAKDVDGFHPVSVGKMMIGEKAFLPCTPHGVIKLLERSGVKTEGAHVVVVGRSNIVGKPVANLLFQKKKNANATVTICHTGTKDLSYFTKQADIIIAATGKPNTITADMVKNGVVIIDVGVNRIEDTSKKSGFRLVGDVDFEALKGKASLITPVPGGVGPMTITMLLFNTVESAKMANRI